MRSASAALTAGLACRAPSTVSDSIVASASAGVTSGAIDAKPSTPAEMDAQMRSDIKKWSAVIESANIAKQ